MPASLGLPPSACAVLVLSLSCSPSPSPSSTAPSDAAAPPLDAEPPDADATAALPDATADAAALSCPKRAGATRLLWTDASYDLVFDKEALACLSDAERAAVAYVGTTLGTDCEWTPGTDLAAPEHMDCKLTTALGLGYQCEPKHKEFLVKWLGSDIPARCARVPITAYAQSVLTELSLTHEGPLITVAYQATSTTGPGGEGWKWSETLGFRSRGPDALKIAFRKPVGKR